jgi:TetR/AcrR family transcriptional repressor of bet genes
VECYFQAAICQRKKIAVWFAFWGEARARPHYRAVCASYDQRHDETLEALCRTLIIQGGYPLAPSSAARIVGSLCHGLWLELLTGSNRLDRLALAELARTSLAALFPRHAQILSGPACAHAGIEGIRT